MKKTDIIKSKSSGFKRAKQQIIRDFEYSYINDCLEASKGNISLAAKAAGIDIKNFYVKMKNCRIDSKIYKIRTP